MERVVPEDHREGSFERRGHDVGAAGELAAPQVHRLVHGAALEEVVALVRAAAGIEEREHTRDEQRRLVVRHGVGSGEDRNRLAVLAVRVGEEERVGRGESVAQDAAFAHEAALDQSAPVESRILGGDEVRGLDVDAGLRAVAERALLQQRGAVDRHAVADAHLADEARPRNAAVAAHAAHRRAPQLGSVAHHAPHGLLERRAVAVHGHGIGRLRGQRVADEHRASGAFVHRGYGRAVAERTFAAAFERGDLPHDRPLADAVVADVRVDDPCTRGEFHTARQAAVQQLPGVEILGNTDARPILGRGAERFDRCDLRGGQIPQFRHFVIMNTMQR